jgi:hypothetical protein
LVAYTLKIVTTVDIAGTAWPLYKLEALAAGLVVFAVAVLLVGSLQVAVLGAAIISAFVWFAGVARSGRQTTRTE